MAFDIDKVRGIVERVARSNGLEVVEVELRGGGKARMLRIVIDRPGAARPGEDRPGGARPGDDGPGGVTHEDCASMSREVSTILDVEDVIPGDSYTLEVSSPGLDRKLTKAADFERFVGSRVKLATYTPVDGERRFEGKLEAFADGKLTIDVSPAKKKPKAGLVANKDAAAKKIEIELANVEKANLVPEF